MIDFFNKWCSINIRTIHQQINQDSYMIINKNVNKYAEDLFRRFPELFPAAENFNKVYITLQNAFVNSKIAFFCGNGGSAADCEHIIGELMKNFIIKRKVSEQFREKFIQNGGDPALLDILQPGMRAVSLLGHPSLSTAFTNDVDPLYCYAQQLFVLGKEGDVVLGISTSGNAENVYQCFRTAKGLGIKTILFTGENCGKCEEFADVILKAPSRETYRIQEYHLSMYHTLCIMLEEYFYGQN